MDGSTPTHMQTAHVGLSEWQKNKDENMKEGGRCVRAWGGEWELGGRNQDMLYMYM